MRCPKCKSGKIIVINTENIFDSFTYRYRKCKLCLCFWQTKETVVEGTIERFKFERALPDEQQKSKVNKRTNAVW